jgi:drug/metabolite transporter (DMT)-like permease
VVGYLAKGLAYGIAGVLFVVAAVRYDPDKARGLDAALRALSEQTYGTLLLLLAAIGFAAYGLFAVAEARYREV